MAGLQRPPGRGQSQRRRLDLYIGDLDAQPDLPVGVPDVVSHGRRNGPVVDDGRRRRPQGSRADSVRLDIAESVGAEHLEPGDPVGLGPFPQRVECPKLAPVGGYHQFATAVYLNAVVGRVVLQRLLAGPAEAGLQRAGLIVEAGMKYATVVSGLMEGERWFLVDDQEGEVWPADQELTGCRQPNDARADNDNVVHRMLAAEAHPTPLIHRSMRP